MRILVISNMYPSHEAPTFGIFVKNQVEALVKQGNHVDVAAITNPKMGKKNVLHKYSTWLLQAGRGLLARKSSYDIVHAHYAFPSGMMARWFKRRFNIPYVVTCHGGDLNKMAKKGRFFRKQTERILQEASHVIAVGRDLEEQVIHDFHVPKDKVSVFSMGVDQNVFHPRGSSVRSQLELSDNQKHVLYVGNIIEEKGIADLVEALALLRQHVPEVILHVVGQPKQAEYFASLTRRIETLQLSGHIHFHGAKPQSEVADWMSAADVFVLPSHTEGFGLVAVEAMACATPVVGTEVGGLTHLLSDGAGVAAEPKNPSSLADSIEQVLSNDVLRQRLIKAGQQKAAANDAEQITKNVLSIYKQAQQKQGERQ
ncbi:Glycosyltransferase involved in cell wall bisynthesis [Alteribacillus persepolensis]|uniref:Glycosyltransferase involved in cell wall bisynthesis n=1 Tax=Alteribacillus persepolensis TaxID=568899 RepID=A0A1G8AD64_9BACI|nr:glycosyltransferase [Alteribacillus persepolensis]SDH18839.1 Glycosyltransferase involved in cell wall bisynthesis [Alteribacillus persepolensis]